MRISVPARSQRYIALLFLSLFSAGTSAGDTITEQVLVTASRVPETGFALPLAWATIDADELAITGHVHISESMDRVSGAWIARGNGQENLPALRSPVLTGAGSCGAFFMAADDIGLRAPGFCNVNQLFDANTEQADRIEVIKGPATSLYGSNAMHGVINILSAPPTDTMDQALSFEGGPHDYYRGKYHYRNVHGSHGISISLNGSTDGGYKDSSGYDQQKGTFRHDYRGDDWLIRSVLDLSNLNQETAGYITGYKSYKNDSLKKDNPNPDAYRDVWSLRLYTRAEKPVGEQHRVIITPYFRNNGMEFLQHYLPWKSREENGHRSLGLRSAVHSEFDSLSWINGVELELTEASLRETQDNEFDLDKPAGTHYDYQVDARTAAAYSQLRLPLASEWELSGGVRFEYTGYDYENLAEDGPACAPEATNCRFYRPPDRSDHFNNWSVNAGISYRFDANQQAYLRLARGFRAPQAAELYRLQGGQSVANLDSERIDNLEFGTRGVALQNLQYDIALYHMRKRDVIFQDADRHTISGASTRHYGAEIALEYPLTENWTITANASFARHRYDSDVELPGSDDNISGNDMDTAPRRFGSAHLKWDLSPLTGRDSRAEMEWIYMGSYYLEPDNEHRYDGHRLVNLRLQSELAPRWHGSLRITNLLDVDYAERADYGFGSYRYFVGEPRGVYGQLTYQFGVD